MKLKSLIMTKIDNFRIEKRTVCKCT